MPGFVEYYNNNFTLALISNAGHEVPMYQREFAFYMFYNFINGQPL